MAVVAPQPVHLRSAAVPRLSGRSRAIDTTQPRWHPMGPRDQWFCRWPLAVLLETESWAIAHGTGRLPRLKPSRGTRFRDCRRLGDVIWSFICSTHFGGKLHVEESRHNRVDRMCDNDG